MYAVTSGPWFKRFSFVGFFTLAHFQKVKLLNSYAGRAHVAASLYWFHWCVLWFMCIFLGPKKRTNQGPGVYISELGHQIKVDIFHMCQAIELCHVELQFSKMHLSRKPIQ